MEISEHVLIVIIGRYFQYSLLSSLIVAWCVHMGAWPSSASQVFGNGCRPARCPTRFLLCSCWLAVLDTPSRSGGQTKDDRDDWPAEWSDRYVAETLVYTIVRCTGYCNAGSGAVVFLEWGFVDVILGEFQFEIHRYIEYGIFCEQRRSHVRKSSVWQVSTFFHTNLHLGSDNKLFIFCRIELFKRYAIENSSIFVPSRNISPVENLSVAIITLGEGWHNYHHVFPWDYKTSEFGTYTFNLSTGFIDFFARIGWAYDRKNRMRIAWNQMSYNRSNISGKFVSADMVARRAAKCGDGTHFLDDQNAHENAVWGLGDADLSPEDLQELNQMCNWLRSIIHCFRFFFVLFFLCFVFSFFFFLKNHIRIVYRYFRTSGRIMIFSKRAYSGLKWLLVNFSANARAVQLKCWSITNDD